MSIETLSIPTSVVESDDTYYHTEEIKLRQYFNMYAPGCMDMLEEAELSEGDLQLLRKVSANYVIASAIRDENDEAARRTILQYASSELAEYQDDKPQGLSRIISDNGDVSICVDGRALTNAELGLMYQLIEPSSEVLDRAARDAQPIGVTDDAYMMAFTHEVAGVTLEESSKVDHLTIYEDDPQLAYEMHTFKDELAPIAGALDKFRRSVIRISGVRIAHDEKQKIAS